MVKVRLSYSYFYQQPVRYFIEVEQAGLLPIFPLLSGYILSSEVKVKLTKIYQELLEKYNLKPEESVFMDDIQVNLDTARKWTLRQY